MLFHDWSILLAVIYGSNCWGMLKIFVLEFSFVRKSQSNVLKIKKLLLEKVSIFVSTP